MKPEYIWWLAGLALLLAELMLPGLTIFFFGLGAMVVGTLCAFFDLHVNLQLVIFLLFSIVSLVALRRWLCKIFQGRRSGPEDTMPEEFVGQRVRVVTRIAPGETGKVEFHGSDWEAEANEAIEPGTPAEIVARKGLTLTVKRRAS